MPILFIFFQLFQLMDKFVSTQDKKKNSIQVLVGRAQLYKSMA